MLCIAVSFEHFLLERRCVAAALGGAVPAVPLESGRAALPDSAPLHLAALGGAAPAGPRPLPAKDALTSHRKTAQQQQQ